MSSLSKTANRDLMAQAREALKGRWGLAVGAAAIYSGILWTVQMLPMIGPIGGLILTGPMALGMMIFALALSRNRGPQLSQLFEGFQRFGTAFVAYLLMTVFIFLWMLLLIIPGIVASYAYSQTFFILADHPDVGALDAISQSKEMMRGNKWKLFCLSLRFIGWSILCILTLGIGFLWLMPYMMISFARFYDDLACPAAEAPVVEAPAAEEPAAEPAAQA